MTNSNFFLLKIRRSTRISLDGMGVPKWALSERMGRDSSADMTCATKPMWTSLVVTLGTQAPSVASDSTEILSTISDKVSIPREAHLWAEAAFLTSRTTRSRVAEVIVRTSSSREWWIWTTLAWVRRGSAKTVLEMPIASTEQIVVGQQASPILLIISKSHWKVSQSQLSSRPNKLNSLLTE